MNATSPAVPEPSLAELAKQANEEHELVERQVEIVVQGMSRGLRHAMAAGDALEAARALVPAGQWGQWVDSNINYSKATATLYMRLAHYRPEVEQWIADGAPGATGNSQILAAHRAIAGLPAANQAGSVVYDDSIRKEAREMRKLGMSNKQIAEHLGVSRNTIKSWFDPGYAKAERQRYYLQQKRRKAEKKALELQERLSRAKARKDPLGESYALLRQTLIQLDAAGSDDPEVRQLLVSAAAAAREALNKTWKAIELS